jgi:hypothetical protein
MAVDYLEIIIASNLQPNHEQIISGIGLSELLGRVQITPSLSAPGWIRNRDELVHPKAYRGRVCRDAAFALLRIGCKINLWASIRSHKATGRNHSVEGCGVIEEKGKDGHRK